MNCLLLLLPMLQPFSSWHEKFILYVVTTRLCNVGTWNLIFTIDVHLLQQSQQ